MCASITSIRSIFFITISLPLTLALPATHLISNDVFDVESGRALAELEQSQSQTTQTFIHGAWRSEQTSSPSHSEDPSKSSQGCTTDACIPGHSVSPNIEPPCICIEDNDVTLDHPKQTSNDIRTNQRPAMYERKGPEKREEVKAEKVNYTYVPPPQTDITADLLAESLAIQPQNTATIGSIIPYFSAGVISYGVQLNGLVAATMTLNASTLLPCDSIGTTPNPNLALIPADVNNATAKPVISDCEIIAVNMYDPNVVQYWVQKHDGGIFSLAGSNKVQNIGATNTTAGVALVLRAQVANQSKRTEEHVCTPDCAHTIAKRALARRAISPADVHTSSFSEKACAAINCNNNGGKPALFNPFTRTCGCADPVFVEIDHSGM